MRFYLVRFDSFSFVKRANLDSVTLATVREATTLSLAEVTVSKVAFAVFEPSARCTAEDCSALIRSHAVASLDCEVNQRAPSTEELVALLP